MVPDPLTRWFPLCHPQSTDPLWDCGKRDCSYTGNIPTAPHPNPAQSVFKKLHLAPFLVGCKQKHCGRAAQPCLLFYLRSHLWAMSDPKNPALYKTVKNKQKSNTNLCAEFNFCACTWICEQRAEKQLARLHPGFPGVGSTRLSDNL